MKGVRVPYKPRETPPKRNNGAARNESQVAAISAVSKLKNIVVAMAKPAGKEITHGKEINPEEEVAPGDANALLGATATGSEEVEIVDEFLPPTLPDIQPLKNKPVANEEETVPSPLTEGE